MEIDSCRGTRIGLDGTGRGWRRMPSEEGHGDMKCEEAIAKGVDLEVLDRRHDARTPSVSVDQLVQHSLSLTETVRAQAEGLRRARVGETEAAQLAALSASLEVQEEQWQAARKRSHTGGAAAARAATLSDRFDLATGLDALLDGDDVDRVLAEVAGVDDDADLDSDVRKLLALARTRAEELEGTDLDAAFVEAARARVEAFRLARVGVVAEGEGATKQVLSEEARQAQALRNRVFWALAEANRRVCKRGQFAFRRDPQRRGLFLSFAHVPRRRGSADAGGSGEG